MRSVGPDFKIKQNGKELGIANERYGEEGNANEEYGGLESRMKGDRKYGNAYEGYGGYGSSNETTWGKEEEIKGIEDLGTGDSGMRVKRIRRLS